jgi:hypothetical protein
VGVRARAKSTTPVATSSWRATLESFTLRALVVVQLTSHDLANEHPKNLSPSGQTCRLRKNTTIFDLGNLSPWENLTPSDCPYSLTHLFTYPLRLTI